MTLRAKSKCQGVIIFLLLTSLFKHWLKKLIASLMPSIAGGALAVIVVTVVGETHCKASSPQGHTHRGWAEPPVES